jgi:hypothetical protein
MYTRLAKVRSVGATLIEVVDIGRQPICQKGHFPLCKLSGIKSIEGRSDYGQESQCHQMRQVIVGG